MIVTVVMVEIPKETPVANAFVPESLDTDLGTLVRQEDSDLRAAVKEVVGVGNPADLPDSEATTVAAVVADLNALLAKLRGDA